jgi:hypothetical protein
MNKNLKLTSAFAVAAGTLLFAGGLAVPLLKLDYNMMADVWHGIQGRPESSFFTILDRSLDGETGELEVAGIGLATVLAGSLGLAQACRKDKIAP